MQSLLCCMVAVVTTLWCVGIAGQEVIVIMIITIIIISRHRDHKAIGWLLASKKSIAVLDLHTRKLRARKQQM